MHLFQEVFSIKQIITISTLSIQFCVRNLVSRKTENLAYNRQQNY